VGEPLSAWAVRAQQRPCRECSGLLPGPASRVKDGEDHGVCSARWILCSLWPRALLLAAGATWLNVDDHHAESASSGLETCCPVRLPPSRRRTLSVSTV